MKLPKWLTRRPGSPRFYLRLWHGGRRYYEGLGTTDAREAVRRGNARRSEILSRGRADEKPSNPPTVSTAGVRWVDEYLASTRCPKARENASRRFRRWIDPIAGPVVLTDVRSPLLGAVRSNAEAAGLAPSTVVDLMSDVRCFFRWAVTDGLLARSPWESRLLPRLKKSAPRRLSDEQVDAILGAAGPDVGAWIRLSLLTGLRWGELRNLTWSRVVQGRRPHLVIDNTKSGRVRRVPLVPEAAEILAGLADGATSPYVLTRRPKHSQGLTRNLRPLLAGAEVRWHWHQLRHTFAYRYIQAGGSIGALQKILGHARIEMTLVYLAADDPLVFGEVEAMGEAFTSQPRRLAAKGVA